jgi:hypothetical protein
VIGALALDGVAGCMSVAAATGPAVFLAFAEQVLAPALARATRRDRGHGQPAGPQGRGGPGRARPGRPAPSLPAAHSPDLNPIEQAWSKLKTRLRAEGAHSGEALEAALGPALAAITDRDARRWFRLCGNSSELRIKAL